MRIRKKMLVEKYEQDRASESESEGPGDDDTWDTEILDELTTSRGELKVRTIGFHRDRPQQFAGSSIGKLPKSANLTAFQKGQLSHE